MYKRIILKLSGEALAGEGQKDFDNTVIDDIIEQINVLMKKNVQVSIVVGGGNFGEEEVQILLWIEQKLTKLVCLQLL